MIDLSLGGCGGAEAARWDDERGVGAGFSFWGVRAQPS